MRVDFALLALSGSTGAVESRRRFDLLQAQGSDPACCVRDPHLWLWASDASALKQTEALTLCGHVRLDNRAELLADLGPDQGVEGTGSDALPDLDLVLQLCAKRGPEALTRISGSFGLALWQGDSACLTVVRDHFGICPLYLGAQDGQLVIASDLRLAAHLDARPLVARADTVSAYLAGFEESETRTVYAGLDRLPRAHVLTWRPGSTPQTQRYWQLVMPEPMPLPDAAPALRAALQRAVALRRGDPAKTGCMLSGGLDSSSIAALATAPASAPAATARKPLRSFSFVYNKSDSFDESPFIAEVNQHIGADPVLIHIERGPQPEDLPQLVEEQFDLCPAPGLLKSRRIYAEARAQGMEALLDGHGGDEVISHGYLRLAELASQGAYLTLWREMRGAARIYGEPVLEPYLAYLYRHAPLRRRSVRRRAIGWIGRRIEGGRTSNTNTLALLHPEYRAAQDVDGRKERADEAFSPSYGPPDERRAHLRTISAPVMVRAFEVLHRSAAAQGIEPIYPFFDRALVELCLRVPPEGKLRGGWSRRVLREAMAGSLPPRVQWRPDKANFNTEVAGFVLAYLDDPDRARRIEQRLQAIVDLSVFWDWYALMRNGPSKESAAVVQVLWQAIYLAAWLERLDHWNACQREGTLW
ncbi:asparagine synthase-related protein [Salipiger sp. PrR002]|uniref:asparagine synthase-related protein n=1 Tax=Salipiger sp. PrR002 TaxID=2706489 RepID=UPI0013B71ED5|nr:asparagine synthase-related protein [Salipiger sp. PrR002]NDW00451.1 hypothetical protein [Salipiger sp. PrR002]NDW56409.1 hypothetical protein [Salipiger sp. PrR004]